MNNVTLMGRVVRDVEVRYSQSTEPVAVTRFNIAVPRRYKKENEANADFINCIAFGKTAEFIGKYFFKGNLIAIIGEIRNNNYTDKNGNKHYSTDILVHQVNFCGSKNKDNENKLVQDDEEFYNIETCVDDENLPF